VLNPEGLRFADEFVRHKVLDAIGDLAACRQPLLAALPGLSAAATNSTTAVLSALMADPTAWRVVEAPAETAGHARPWRRHHRNGGPGLCSGSPKSLKNQAYPPPLIPAECRLIAWPERRYLVTPSQRDCGAAGATPHSKRGNGHTSVLEFLPNNIVAKDTLRAARALRASRAILFWP